MITLAFCLDWSRCSGDPPKERSCHCMPICPCDANALKFPQHSFRWRENRGHLSGINILFMWLSRHYSYLITTNTQTADAGLDTWHWRESDHFCFAWIKIISHFLEHKINFNKEPLKHLQTCSTLNYLKLLQGIWTAGKIYWYVGIQGSIDHFFKQKVSQSFFRNELLTLHSC